MTAAPSSAPSAAHAPQRARGSRDPLGWHLALLLVVSGAYEALFVGHGMSLLDEGWVLRAAKALDDGGVLYRDAFFPFPPGHVVRGWIGYAVSPPGILGARVVDAVFDVALCLALYLLGRRLLPAGFALLGAALLALAAPSSHLAHYLFGYRYLVFSVLALLAFARRVEGGGARWCAVAGGLTGVALCFRLSPAVAVACGIAVGIATGRRRLRDWLRDGVLFAAGSVAVAAPVYLWLGWSVGWEVLWMELGVRPAWMTALQSLPFPPLALPASLERGAISRAWTSLQFRLYAALYVVYAGTLGLLWLRAVLRRRRFAHPLLLAVTVWGGVYYARVVGRSDIGHLESAIPPACLLIAHGVWVTLWAVGARVRPLGSPAVKLAAGVAVLAAWVFLFGTDRYLWAERRGSHPLVAGETTLLLRDELKASVLGDVIGSIHEFSAPEEPILDLSVAPLLHLLAGRGGVPHSGMVMPGTFLRPGEEEAVIEALRASPPAMVVASTRPFDLRRSRSLLVTAPSLTRWVARHYETVRWHARYQILVPRPEPLSLEELRSRAGP